MIIGYSRWDRYEHFIFWRGKIMLVGVGVCVRPCGRGERGGGRERGSNEEGERVVVLGCVAASWASWEDKRSEEAAG